MKTKKKPIEVHTCFKCNRTIDEKANYLKLITMNNEKVIEEVWFHLNPNCWGEFNDDKVNARVVDMQKLGLNMLRNAGMIA